MAERAGSQAEGIIARLIARAWKDPQFKQRLIEHPTATLRTDFGIEVPAGVELNVLEETQQRAYLVLPLQPHETPDEGLSDEELASWERHHTALPADCTGSYGPCLPNWPTAGCIS